MNRWVVRVGPEHAEAALARLLDASPAGLQELGAGEFVVYDEPPAQLPGLLSVRAEAVPEGWETAFHAHVPRVVAGRFAVRPPWVEGESDDLVIDPGTAFADSLIPACVSWPDASPAPLRAASCRLTSTRRSASWRNLSIVSTTV